MRNIKVELSGTLAMPQAVLPLALIESLVLVLEAADTSHAASVESALVLALVRRQQAHTIILEEEISRQRSSIIRKESKVGYLASLELANVGMTNRDERELALAFNVVLLEAALVLIATLEGQGALDKCVRALSRDR